MGAFCQDAPKRHTDLAHTRLLHLQQQELAILRQQLFPACRVLATLQSEKNIDPGGHRKSIVCDETLDFVEEVEDQVKNQIVEIEVGCFLFASSINVLMRVYSYRV